MRVKQTARKSTASHAGSSSGSRPQVMNDAVRTRMRNLLQTKRKSLTPHNGSSSASSSYAGGAGKGKRVVLGSSGFTDPVKTKPKLKPGQLALKEIKKLRKSYELLIPRAPFHRLIREITAETCEENAVRDNRPGGPTQIRYQTAALEALQEAAEYFLVRMFEDSYLCCLHSKRVTLFVQDMQLCRRLQSNSALF